MKIIPPLCPHCLHSRLICWRPHWQQKGMCDVLIGNKPKLCGPNVNVQSSFVIPRHILHIFKV